MPKPSVLPTKKDWESFVKDHKEQTSQLKKLDLSKSIADANKGDDKGVFQGLEPAEALMKECNDYYKAAKKIDGDFADVFRNEIMEPIAGYLDRVSAHRDIVRFAPDTAHKCAEQLRKLDPDKKDTKQLTDAVLKITQLLSSVKVAVDTLRKAPIDTSDFDRVDVLIRDCKKRLIELEQVVQIAEKEGTDSDLVSEWWYKRSTPTADMLEQIGDALEKATKE